MTVIDEKQARETSNQKEQSLELRRFLLCFVIEESCGKVSDGRKQHQEIRDDDRCSHKEFACWTFMSTRLMKSHKLRADGMSDNSKEIGDIGGEWGVVQAPILQVVVRGLSIPIAQ
jgi:hypothetical protein